MSITEEQHTVIMTNIIESMESIRDYELETLFEETGVTDGEFNLTEDEMKQLVIYWETDYLIRTDEVPRLFDSMQHYMDSVKSDEFYNNGLWKGILRRFKSNLIKHIDL